MKTSYKYIAYLLILLMGLVFLKCDYCKLIYNTENCGYKTSSINLLSINDGSKLNTDETYTIQWEYTGNIKNVKIELVATGFPQLLETIENNLSVTTGNYEWIPRVIGEGYKVRISDVNDANTFDESETVFSIEGTDTINIPNGTVNNSTPVIKWRAASINNPEYKIRLSDDEDFINIVDEASNLTETEYPLEVVLEDKTMYYWKVAVIESGQINSWNPIVSFYVDLSAVSLISPLNGSTIGITKPTFDWEDSALSNVKYHIQLSTSNDFYNIIEESNEILVSNYTTVVNNLDHLSTYYWRVSVIDGNNVEGAYSEIFSFTIDLGSVILETPETNAYINNTLPNFTWSSQNTPQDITYILEIYKSPEFIIPILTKTGLENTNYTLVVSEELDESSHTEYHWRVTPINSYGVEGTSDDSGIFILDTSSPSSNSIIPISSSTISSNQEIVIIFNETIDLNNTATSGTIGNIVGSWSTTNNNNDTLTLTPETAWTIGSQTLNIDCFDLAGNNFYLSLNYNVN